MWTRHNVLEWIGFHVEDSRFDASLLNINYCNMDGITLCTLSKETLMSMFGSMLGQRLHHNLESQKARYGEQQRQNLFEEAFEVLVLECINIELFVSTATDLSETCLSESELDLLDNILQNSFPYMHGPSLGPLLETVVVQPSIPSGEKQTPLCNFSTQSIIQPLVLEITFGILFTQTILRKTTATLMSTTTS